MKGKDEETYMHTQAQSFPAIRMDVMKAYHFNNRFFPRKHCQIQ